MESTITHDIVIVGAGLMGFWHAAYAKRCGARIVAVVDTNLAAAETLRVRCGGEKVFGDLQECLQEPTAKIVHICTPTESHTPLIETALRLRRHVLVEKPAAPTSYEARRLVDLARESDLRLCAVHQFPYQSGMQALLRRLPRLGELVSIAFTAATSGGEGRSGSKRRDVLLEILPHPVSLLHALFAKRLAESRWCVSRLTSDDLYISGLLGETDLSIRVSLRARPTRNELTLIGTHGTAHVDLYHGFCAFELGNVSRSAKLLQPFRRGAGMLGLATTNLLRRAILRHPAYPGLPELIASFYAAVHKGRSPQAWTDQILLSVSFAERVQGQGDAADRSDWWTLIAPTSDSALFNQ